MLELKFDDPTREELSEALKKIRLIEPKESKDAKKKEALDFMNMIERLSGEVVIYETYKRERKESQDKREKILDKKIADETEKRKAGRKNLNLPGLGGEMLKILEKENIKNSVKNHEGRLNRQGRDIFILWKKVDELTKENNKMIFVARELLRHSDLEIKIEKNDRVRLKARGRRNL